MPMCLSMEKLTSASLFQILPNDNISEIFLISFSIIILTLTIVHNMKSKSAANLNLPPGPWKLPLIGNLHQLVGHQPHRRLQYLAKKYSPDVMHMQLGELPHIVISSPEAAEQVMKTHDLAFASRPALLATNVMLYNLKDIAFAPYGEQWRQLRKICVQELFSFKRVLSFRQIREEQVSNHIQLLSPCATAGEPVNLSAIITMLTASVISRAVFGQVQELTQDFMVVLDNISDAVAGFQLSDFYPSLKFLPYLNGFKAKLDKMHKASDAILEQIIDQHISKRRSMASTKDHEDDDAHQDLVDVLLNLQEDHSLEVPITMDIIKAVTLEMFVGGIDTSATTILWTMSEMIRQPRVLIVAQEEVRQVFGKNGNVDEANLDQLKYLDMIIAETLRLHPPAPFLLPRESREKVVLNGCDIPIKTRVIVNAWAINRDSRYWTDAEKFFPERFRNCSTDYKGSDFQFIPFGAGRRICPGIGFGMTMVKLTLANLLYHFDWTLPAKMKPENLDMEEIFGSALTRKTALHVIPFPYNNVS